MAKRKGDTDNDAELAAMVTVYGALNTLDGSDAQQRVVDYVVKRLGLSKSTTESGSLGQDQRERQNDADDEQETTSVDKPARRVDTQEDDLEGVSAVAQKWAKRSGLTTAELSKLFSLGVDEIDLVASKVPGQKKIDRLRNVLLLKGIASYLGTGAARVEWAKLKEAAGHYDADAGGNFTTYMQKLTPFATGSVASGFTLTSRGLTEARDLIKEMTKPKE